MALHFGLSEGTLPVIFGHLIFVLPYFVLTLSGAYNSWDIGYGRAAAALAASPARTLFQIKLPMLLAPILGAVAIAIAVSVGQFLPTLLLGGGRVETLTTQAVTLASGGDRRAIGVFALLQILAAVIPYFLAIFLPKFLWRYRKGMSGA